MCRGDVAAAVGVLEACLHGGGGGGSGGGKCRGLGAPCDSSENSVLHLMAERHAFVDVVALAVAAGCDVTARNKALKTPVMVAAACGDAAMLAALIHCGQAAGQRGSGGGGGGVCSAPECGARLPVLPTSGEDVATPPAVSARDIVCLHKKNAWSALMYAAKVGSLACIQALLVHGASVEEENKEGATALYIAARESPDAVAPDTLAALVAAGAVPTHRTRSGRTPLLAAAAAGRVAAVQALCAAAGAPRLIAAATDTSGVTVFHEVAAVGHLPVLAALLAVLPPGDARAAQLNARDTTGRTAVHYAAASGVPSMVAALLASGWEADCTDDRGCTPLYYAAMKDDVGALDVLLTAGAAPAGVNPQRTALHVAAMWGAAAAISRLLQALAGAAGGVAAAIAARDRDGATPVEVARARGHAAAAAVLEDVANNKS